MDLQQQASKQLVDALGARGMGTRVAFSQHGYAVSVTEHPSASVHFGFDRMGGLSVQIVFDGRPPVGIDYPLPTPDAAKELADSLVAQIAGEGGGASHGNAG